MQKPAIFAFRLHISVYTLVFSALTIGQAIPVIAQSSSSLDCGPVLEARFTESAPRDRFEFVNRSSDDWDITRITLDLSESSGNLIFDTVDGGDGVEVFQPFKTDDIALMLKAKLPEDGGNRIEISFENFMPGTRFLFTIDVDDQLDESELGQKRVSGSEIEGAVLSGVFVSPQGQEQTVVTYFDEKGGVESAC